MVLTFDLVSYPTQVAWRCATYGKGIFVALADQSSGTDQPRIITSKDGITWKPVPPILDPRINYDFRGVTCSGELFVAVGNDVIAYSSDAIS